jgi:predicted metal-dependent hydrolase
MPIVSKKIKHQGQELVFNIKRRARIRYVRLSIDRTGTLTLTAPKSYPFFLLKLFVTNKWSWILEKSEQKKNSKSLLAIKHTKVEINQYKKNTKLLVLERLEYYRQFYHFGDHLPGGKISVRDQKSRWGSCSSRGNLNFNYRLSLLPRELADYIIVHELCHLQEMNHSRNFWQLVAQTQPNYKQLKKALKSI